jgi:Flp pilus assembly protein TadD
MWPPGSPIQLSAALLLLLTIAPSGFAQTAPTKSQQIDAHARQAQEFLRATRTDDAVREFEAILRLDPNNVDAHGNLGVTLYFKGDYTQAVPHLRTAVKLQPNLWKIQALLGMSERRSGQVASAQADLQKCFSQLQEEKPRIQAGMELVEIYYGASQIERASAVVNALRQIAP